MVIPTLGRRISASRTVRSVLANDYPNVRVVLVDQCAEPLSPGLLPADARFKYLQSETAGISAARNVGVEACEADVIAHTDDDCEAPADWLAGVARTFAEQPEVDLAFGDVRAGPTPEGGFIPTFTVRRRLLAKGLSGKHRVEGIGACFAYRRAVWEQVGGFDEALGAGAELRSAEEVDFTNRALAAGYAALETDGFSVVHHGYRTWESQSELLSSHLYGIGATSAKQLRLGRAQYLYVLTRLGWRWAFGRPVVDFGRPPMRWPRLQGFCRGFSAGWRRSTDARGRFQASGATTRPAEAGVPAGIASRRELFPDFFLIGAEDAGLDRVADALESEPDIFVSPVRDTGFLACEDPWPVTQADAAGPGGTPRLQTLAEYADLFRGAGGARAIGEASASYLQSPRAAERIRLWVPGAKLIAVLRNPIDRAWAAFQRRRERGLETREALADGMPGFDYLEPGRYFHQLESFKPELQAGRLQIHLWEDLQADPEQAIESIRTFLGVDESRRGAQLRPPEDGRAPEETRERLVEYYREDILRLEDLLGRNLSGWLA